MNWEMTLTVEKNKGRDEGELLKLIKLVLKKLSRGQNAGKIADDLVEDLSLVKTICGIISESNSSDPEEILSIIKARQAASRQNAGA